MALPTLSTLEDFGLSSPQIQHVSNNMATDGEKKVNYKPMRVRSVRAFQTTQTRRRLLNFSGSRKSRVPQSYKYSLKTQSKTQSKTYPEMKITPHGEKIASVIVDNPVSAVDSPTGTGKTRYLPYLMATKGYKVRVSIPTVIAVRNAYKFQREYSMLRVGFAAGREIQYSDDDQLVYATTGHFTQRILGIIKNNKNNSNEQIKKVLGDILFVDEVHTATSQITLLIGLIRYIFTIDNVYTGPKIVFSTATFNHGDIMDHFSNFPIYRVELENMPIEDIYLETFNDPMGSNPNVLIAEIIKKELVKWKNSHKKYHGIIFRPGIFEVESTIEYLYQVFKKEDNIEFYPAYSNLTPDEMDNIFKESDYMKVVVGTNIIESSITIDDVGFIIDDMLEKIAETSDIGGNKLTLKIISKSSSQQRRGRTGRTLPGRAYRLITKEDYDKLNPFRIREIDRIPIYDIVLQLIDAGLDPREIIKISISRYDQARKTLLRFGMIETNGDKYIVTNAGKFVSSIPMSIQNAYLIYLGYQQYIINKQVSEHERLKFRTVIALASMLESYGPSYFYVPRKQYGETILEYNARKSAYTDKYHERFRGVTDIHTLINIFWSMIIDIDVAQQYDKRSRRKFPNYVKEWSVENSMNNKKLKEFYTVFRDAESIIESKLQDNVPLHNDRPYGGYDDLSNYAAELFSIAYRANLLTRSYLGNNLVYMDQNNEIAYRINRSNTFSKVKMSKKSGPVEIITAQTIEVIGSNGYKLNLAGIFITEQYFSSVINKKDTKIED